MGGESASESSSTEGLDSGFRQRISLQELSKVNNPCSIHGIYPYRGKMSGIDAAQVISQLPRNWTLLDPFCGTGTILYEAQVHGMSAIGVDNNPLACTIAQGKTEPLDVKKTLDHLVLAISDARSLEKSPRMSSSVAQYFHPITRHQIMRMVAVSDGFSAFEHSILYGSICVTARACNGWTWTSTSIGRVSPKLRPIDFYDVMMRKARKHVLFVKGTPSVRILCHDTRHIHEVLPEQSVNVVYTSPPYFDALDYTGYYSRLVLDILKVDRAELRKGLIQSFSTYRSDMTQALRSIQRVVREDGLVILVVGDRMVRRRLIRGSEFFAEIAPWGKPYVIERSYTETPSGLWDRINMTDRKEEVLVWDLREGGLSR